MISMRFPISARAAGLGIVLIAVQPAISQSERPTSPAPAQTTTPDPSTSADAARHVKRTACAKEARTKKLVGAQRNAYIKSCVAAPSKS
jgi:hypothetical protein